VVGLDGNAVPHPQLVERWKFSGRLAFRKWN